MRAFAITGMLIGAAWHLVLAFWSLSGTRDATRDLLTAALFLASAAGVFVQRPRKD